MPPRTPSSDPAGQRPPRAGGPARTARPTAPGKRKKDDAPRGPQSGEKKPERKGQERSRPAAPARAVRRQKPPVDAAAARAGAAARPAVRGFRSRAEALFPPLPPEASRLLDRLPEALERVWPLSAAHRRSLPEDIARLSRLLTTERGGLSRPYWSSPAAVSAYLYYFLPWNLVRLVRLLTALPLPDPLPIAARGGEALLLDAGSGPLTLPLALWLARPQWRAAPLRVLALDTSAQPLELGRKLFAALGLMAGQAVWPVRTVRAPLEQAARQAAPLLADGRVRPWLVSAANVLNELRFGTRAARGLMEEEDGPEGHADGDAAEARPEGCRDDRLESLLEAFAPLLRVAGPEAAQGPSLLFVEPGTRLGGSTVMRLRQLAVEGGLSALAPCPHTADCPLLRGQGGRTWCHFTFGSEGAPDWLTRLSREAGLGKSGLSLAPLLLAAERGAHCLERPPAPRGGADTAVRVLSAPFVVPGLAGRGRYACSERGLLLLEDAERAQSGDLLTVSLPADAPRDRKSGARIVRP